MSSRLKSYYFLALILSCWVPALQLFGTTTIPFTLVNGLIITEASVDQKIGKFIVDTGADGLILNSEMDGGSEESTYSTLQGEIVARPTLIKEFAFGNIQIANVQAYAMNLESIESYTSYTINGIIGLQLLAKGVYEIDMEHHLIKIYTQDDALPDHSDFYPYRIIQGVPVVSIEFDGIDYDFILDSGASKSVIDAAIVERHPHHFIKLNGEVDLVTASQTSIKASRVMPQNLKIGDKLIQDQSFLVTNFANFQSQTNSTISGLLSIATLTSGKVIIDAIHQRISL